MAIFDVLKRSEGLAVGDIADALEMSYMGVKQYCLELEKRGYLDTWRRAKATGRPELTYRLTAKAQVLFPQQSTDLSMEILEAVRQLHGPTAAEKILYQYFVRKGEAYARKLKGQSMTERANSLAKLRESEGHCAQVDVDARHGLRLTEFHNPLAELMKAYPSAARMEEAMLSRLLQAPVRREQNAVSGLMKITFLVAGATLPPPAPVPAAATPRTRPATIKRVERTAEPVAPDSAFEGGEDSALAAESVPATPFEPGLSEPLAPAAIAPAEPVAEKIAEAHELVEPATTACDSSIEPRGTPAPMADPIRSINETPLLFSTEEVAPSPRHPARTVSPSRPAAKPAAPVVEELFLSL